MEPLRYPLPDETPFLWRTALQAAERHVRHLSCTYSIRGLPHVRQHGLFLFIALMRMVTFRMKVVHNLSVWALRARSYKTRAEDWAAGHRPPSSSRGLSWFLSCFQQWVQELQGAQGVQKGSIGSRGSKGSRGSRDLSNDCLSHSSSSLFLTISHPHLTHAHA